MATGQQAFEARTQSGVIAAILEREPVPVSSLQPSLPPGLDRLIATCLAKDPAERRQTMHDVLLDLQWIAEGGSQAGIPARVSWRRRWRERSAWLVASLCALAVVALGVATYRLAHRDVRVVHACIPAPENNDSFLNTVYPGPVSVSPDGRWLAFTAIDNNQTWRLWVRDLGSDVAWPLEGTEHADYPFWSPDSRMIGYFADQKLKTIEVSGGRPWTLCDAANGKGGTWNSKGTIVFAPAAASGLYRLSDAGGVPTAVAALDTLRKETSHRHPRFLPDGRRFLYLAWNADSWAKTALMVGTLDGDENRMIMPAESNVAYASGNLLFVREGTLMAQPFDPRRLRLIGEAMPIADGIRTIGGASVAVFSISQDNVLAFLPGGDERVSELVWVNPKGEPTGRLGDRAQYAKPHFSPDGTRLAVEITDPRTETSALWIYDTSSGIRTRFTFDMVADESAVWSPDGTSIVFSSARAGHLDLYLKALSGTQPEKLLFASQKDKRATDWSADGRFILFECEGDVWVLPLFGDRQPYPYLQGENAEDEARFSPDGRWVVYQSDESGMFMVYVTAFPDPGRKWQVSKDFGFRPAWLRESGNIIYIDGEAVLTTVEVRAEKSSFVVEASRRLFSVWGATGGSMTSDGQRGILVLPTVENEARQLTLILNWKAALHQH